jgi:hypothetical protein
VVVVVINKRAEKLTQHLLWAASAVGPGMDVASDAYLVDIDCNYRPRHVSSGDSTK